MLFFKINFLVLVLLLFSKSVLNADDNLIKLRDSINHYYYSFDIDKLKQVLQSTENYLKSNPNSYYGNYYNGIVRYCLGRIVFNEDKDLSYEYFDTSLDKFQRAWEIEKNPVALAMVSAAYGKKSALSPLRAIFFGQKAKNRIYDAYKLDTNNSKINLVAATHLMHVPGIYGGDKKRARQLLLKSLKHNSKNNLKSDYELIWADDAEIYAYLAQIDILENKIDAARIYMKKALELKPEYGFVLIDLENQILRSGK